METKDETVQGQLEALQCMPSGQRELSQGRWWVCQLVVLVLVFTRTIGKTRVFFRSAVCSFARSSSCLGALVSSSISLQMPPSDSELAVGRRDAGPSPGRTPSLPSVLMARRLAHGLGGFLALAGMLLQLSGIWCLRLMRNRPGLFVTSQVISG